MPTALRILCCLTLTALLPASPAPAAVTVSTAAGLADAVAEANAGGDGTILLRDGTYTIDDMLWIEADGVTVRGASGNRDAVIIRGRGMDGGVTHIFNVNGSDFSASDMTLRDVANHAVQLQLDVDNVTLRNLHILDTYEQMVKIPYEAARPELTSDNGVMEDCLLEYSAGIGPQYYIGGIDAHNARGWTVRDNVFRDIRSPAGDMAEFAVHFWSDSRDTLVERNIIINCDRGIGFGLGERGHRGGVIRNNMIYHDATEGFADVGIALESCPGAEVYNNTVFFENGYPNAVEYRWPATTDVSISNNLTNRAITSRDGGAGTLLSNVTGAVSAWFTDPGDGDLHLSHGVPGVVDAGIAIAGLTDDIDGGARPHGGGIDIGADEYGSGAPVPIPGSGDPAPLITANGSRGPLAVSPGTPVSIAVSLDPRSRAGQEADWWAACNTSLDMSGTWYSYIHPRGWFEGLTRGHAGPLAGLAETGILSRTLPAGDYTFYFGVDTTPDASVDQPLWYESVQVHVR